MAQMSRSATDGARSGYACQSQLWVTGPGNVAPREPAVAWGESSLFVSEEEIIQHTVPPSFPLLT